MMEIKIKISEVDYAAAVDALMPVLADKLSGCTNPIASLVLGKAKDLSANAAKAALKALPQSAKDELAAACLNRYGGEIARVIAGLADRKNIPVKVEGVAAAALD